jgi:guanine nucleotide-binding protein alpha-1 subunit
VEEALMHRLSSTSGSTSAAVGSSGSSRSPTKSGIREVAVNSTIPWKDVLTRALGGHRDVHPENGDIDWDDPDDPGHVLFDCKEDMKALWAHPVVQELLEKQNVRLEEMAGFFLDCLDEVAGERYIPNDGKRQVCISAECEY